VSVVNKALRGLPEYRGNRVFPARLVKQDKLEHKVYPEFQAHKVHKEFLAQWVQPEGMEVMEYKDNRVFLVQMELMELMGKMEQSAL
jgi:hypothetical protein